MKLLPLFCSLLGLSFLVGCGRKAEPVAPAAQAIPVRVASVRLSTEAIPVRATATLHRKTEAVLAFKVGGVIETVSVRVGDRVVKGQVVAALQTEEIDAQLALANAGAEKARRDVARAEALHAEKVATLEMLQDARTALEAAEAQVRAAEFNRRHAVIVAPADGRVLARSAEPNETVAPGRAIVTLSSETDGWLAKASLPEGPARAVRVGDAALVFDPASGTSLGAGRVSQIGEAVEAATRTVPVEVAVERVPEGVRSGSVVTIQLQTAAVAPRAVIPASALVEGAGRRAWVFWLNPDGTSVRREQVGIEALWRGEAYLDRAEAETSRVVEEGAEYLRDGAVVNVKN